MLCFCIWWSLLVEFIKIVVCPWGQFSRYDFSERCDCNNLITTIYLKVWVLLHATISFSIFLVGNNFCHERSIAVIRLISDTINDDSRWSINWKILYCTSYTMQSFFFQYTVYIFYWINLLVLINKCYTHKFLFILFSNGYCLRFWYIITYEPAFRVFLWNKYKEENILVFIIKKQKKWCFL